jgi:hypothetical protein
LHRMANFLEPRLGEEAGMGTEELRFFMTEPDEGLGVGWLEDRNTTHWLENRGTIPAVEISVDIVRQE